MKTPTTPVRFQIQDLERHDRAAAILSQLRGKYETSIDLPYTAFILNLEKEIDGLLTNPQITWEQTMELWEDQHIVREAIVDDYYEYLIP